MKKEQQQSRAVKWSWIAHKDKKTHAKAKEYNTAVNEKLKSCENQNENL